MLHCKKMSVNWISQPCCTPASFSCPSAASLYKLESQTEPIPKANPFNYIYLIYIHICMYMCGISSSSGRPHGEENPLITPTDLVFLFYKYFDWIFCLIKANCFVHFSWLGYGRCWHHIFIKLCGGSLSDWETQGKN